MCVSVCVCVCACACVKPNLISKLLLLIKLAVLCRSGLFLRGNVLVLLRSAVSPSSTQFRETNTLK